MARLMIASPDGATEVLEGTTVHPIWSVDRNEWIQLSELKEGERLQAANGYAVDSGRKLGQISGLAGVAGGL